MELRVPGVPRLPDDGYQLANSGGAALSLSFLCHKAFTLERRVVLGTRTARSHLPATRLRAAPTIFSPWPGGHGNICAVVHRIGLECQ